MNQDEQPSVSVSTDSNEVQLDYGEISSERDVSNQTSHQNPPPVSIQDSSNPNATGLILNDLTWFTTDLDLETLVRSAGVYDAFEPLEVTFFENKVNGKSRGQAYLAFKTHAAADKAKVYIERVQVHGVSPKVTWFISTPSRSNPFRVVAKDKDQRVYRDGSTANSSSGGGPQRHGHGGFRQQTPYDRPGGGRHHHPHQPAYPQMYPPPQMMMYPGAGRGGRGEYYGGGYPPRGGYGRR